MCSVYVIISIQIWMPSGTAPQKKKKILQNTIFKICIVQLSNEVIAQNEWNGEKKKNPWKTENKKIKPLNLKEWASRCFFPLRKNMRATQMDAASREQVFACTLLVAVPEIHTMRHTSEFTLCTDCTRWPFLLHKSTILKCISHGCFWTIYTYVINWRSILEK